MKPHTRFIVVTTLLATASISFASTTLKGTYTPDNETSLMKQLTPQGFEYFNSYQHNPDGSATVKAIDARGDAEPIANISISKDGLAAVTDSDMNTRGATAHN